MSERPDIKLIRTLVRASFPKLSSARIRAVSQRGTDNYIYRIDDDLALRIACSDETAPALICREQVALEELSDLSLETPKLLAYGFLPAPDTRPWMICNWLEGKSLELSAHVPTEADARRLALFLLDLQGCRKEPASEPAPDNHWRGIGLAKRDTLTRKSIVTLSDAFDAGKLRRLWHASVNAATCPRKDYTWIHGDLHPGNLIVRSGALTGVIDWGLGGLGDPACDLMAGYTVFDGAARDAFAAAMNASEADWRRGRGWALSTAVIALAHYRDGDTPIVRRARRVIETIMAESA
ncbi:phosphotransferase [Henriciella sp. AS95]|uniref:phosphotransferase n=1 Tax=Henriciella sp. AS95 TaxID=3135782 RepID=UPI00316D214A